MNREHIYLKDVIREIKASWIALQTGKYKTYYKLELTKQHDYALCAWILDGSGKPRHYYIKDNIKNDLNSSISAIRETLKKLLVTLEK